mgnify:CR=1 FL=1
MVQRLDCRIIKFLCRHCAAFSFCREVVKLAATRLIALHKNKGKSVAACLKSRTDYAQNPDKTQQGELVSSYECSPLTVDEEFMLSKRQYELMTGRRQKNDVIAYQIRQSFKPGEIIAEEANKVGYELAMRFTKGKYAFIVATHTDREHIHNHIIYNSTALDSTRKFRDFLLSGLAVQRLSDLICLEHQLSVIEIKPYRERQKRTLYPPRESNRDKLCAVIDNILLNEKPSDFETFLQKVEQQGYEIKRGKHTSVKGTRQKRFIRFRTLGAGYSEDEIKAVIAGEAEHCPHQKQPPKEQPFHLLVDIQAKLSEGKGEGYARWAKRYNLKEMSKTLIFLQENKIGSIEEMQERVNLPMIKLVHHEMVINSKFLEVPRSYYQRNLNANRVKRIAAEFDERIANAPKVSYRDGHYYVFDGQHTIAARKLLNNNCDLNIVCKVYSGLTEQQEALLFAQQTGVSAPLTAGAKMRAKIRGGDPEAIAFLNATNRAGFGLSFAQSHAKWKIACIATAFAEYRKHGERIYTDALRVLAEAWEGDIDSLRAEVLQGVTQFVALYDHEYDPIRLIRQLQRTSPVAIYRSGQAMTGPNYQKYMLQILKAYNGSSRTKSLPIKQ